MPHLARLLRLAGLHEDYTATINDLKRAGSRAATEVGHLVQKAMTEIASVDEADPIPAAAILHRLASDLGDLLDPASFLASLIRTVPSSGTDARARPILASIIRTARTYTAHPHSERLCASLVRAA